MAWLVASGSIPHSTVKVKEDLRSAACGRWLLIDSQRGCTDGQLELKRQAPALSLRERNTTRAS